MTETNKAGGILFEPVDKDSGELATVVTELTEEAVRTVLQVGPEQPLRAIGFRNFLYIGVATGAAPVHMQLNTGGLCLILRGRTVMLLCKGEPALANVECHDGPPSDEALLLVSQSLGQGDEAEQAKELRSWKWGDPVHNLAPPIGATGANELGEILRQLIDAQGQSPALVVGETSIEGYSLDKLQQNDAPEHHKMMTALPAYATSPIGTWPHPVTLVMSMLSFYLEQLKNNVDAGWVDAEQGKARIMATERVVSLLKGEHPDKLDDWPLTVELWTEAGE